MTLLQLAAAHACELEALATLPTQGEREQELVELNRAYARALAAAQRRLNGLTASAGSKFLADQRALRPG